MSSKIVPTEEQRRAIEHEGDRFVLRASAGTGKTTTLVQRYLRHVQTDGFRPDQILTLTFTRKAAAEMKTRIVKELNREGLRDEAQIAETGPIQTIHGFCERILRECSVDAGLDPDFEVLDATEASRRMTFAIQAAIAGISGVPLAEALLERLAGRARYRGGANPHSLLEEVLRTVVHSLRGSTLTRHRLEIEYENPVQVRERWQELMLEEAPLSVRAAMAQLDAGGSFGVRLKRAYRTQQIPAPKGLPSEGAEAEGLAMDQRCVEDSCGLVQLACRTWAAYEQANAAENALDFAKLEQDAVDLLENRPHALDRLRRQYKALLVDEAQDLNPIQHRLIEILSLQKQLFVGDAQQSIYAFRQADVELFKRQAVILDTLDLSRNRRSEEGILHFVDDLFSVLWDQDYRRMAATEPEAPRTYPGVEIWPQKSRDSLQIAEWIQQLIAEGEPPGEIAVLTRSSFFAQALLVNLERLQVPARIAGGSERYYLRIEVRDMANVLTALCKPGDNFSLLCVLNSPLCGLSMDSIVRLAHAKPVRESLEAFEPPVEEDRNKLEAFRAWFDPISRFADRQSAWELLSAVLARSPYLANVAARPRGVQTIANVRKLLSIAAGIPGVDALTFAARMREIRELRHQEGDAPASENELAQVTIMTIHKAKGLEFDVVVVPEMLRNPRPMGDIEIDKAAGMVTAKFEAGGSMFHHFNADRRKIRDQSEELRLLYVALTRAKRRLCLVVNPGGKNTTLGGLVSESLGWQDGIPETVQVRQASLREPEAMPVT